MTRRPWSEVRDGLADTTRRRVEIRLLFLGWTHERLGEELGRVDGGPALAGATIRNYLLGRRAWRRSSRDPLPHPIDRFAAAMGVPVESLEPGGPWEPLTATPESAA